jgi:hypothetical protein
MEMWLRGLKSSSNIATRGPCFWPIPSIPAPVAIFPRAPIVLRLLIHGVLLPFSSPSFSHGDNQEVGDEERGRTHGRGDCRLGLVREKKRRDGSGREEEKGGRRPGSRN